MSGSGEVASRTPLFCGASAEGEPSAGREPSVERESSAEGESSAGREPSARRGSELGARIALALFAGALVLVWALAGPRTPDLAAASYRVALFKQLGFTLVDEHWYGGHDMPGYSLLFPALGALLGLRVVGALAVLCSSVLFERLVGPLYGRGATWGAALFSLAALGDVWSGRVAFALGVPFALAALLCLARGRTSLAAALALACAAASPVAGALLGLAALTLTLLRGSLRPLLALALPAATVVIALALLFPEGGYEPFPLLSFLAAAAVGVVFVLALPRGGSTRALRVGGVLYLLACLACLPVRTPMGSNIERYGVLLAAPLLLCAWVAAREELRGPELGLRWRRRAPAPRAAVASSLAGIVGLLAIVVWVAWGPVRETLAVAGSEATSAAYYAPLEGFLARVERHSGPVRVELPLTRSHWEAALLAPDVALARGWEKQLEERYDAPLLSSALTAASYQRWLRQQAVSYVALPDVRLDASSALEGRLIGAGLPFLREVFRTRHWRVYKVDAATPLLSGPGRLVSLGHQSFAIGARRPASFLVRVHYTRYWAFARGRGCIAAAPGDWTRVSVESRGTAVIEARFSLSRALGLAGACSDGAQAGARADNAPLTVALRARRGELGPLAPGGVDGLPLYRWMVSTSGPPPTIAQENAHRGTSAWRLAGPSELIGGEARGAIAGYVSEQSILPGEVERVYVDAPRARRVRIEVFRMGWYGGRGGRLVLRSRRLPAQKQPRCAHDYRTGLTQCDWHVTLAFPLPSALPSGVYIVKLRAGGAHSDCMFVLRPARPPKLLVEIPTASYEAYNSWGGDDLYPGGADKVGLTGTNQGVEVSYDRPYATQTGAGQFFIREVAAVRFLERYGYPVGYTTIESLDREPGQLAGVRAFIDVGHSEYWSQSDERALVAALAGGTSLIFLSSDTMAWRVRFAPAGRASSQAGEPDHRIIAYKQFANLDPDRADVTGLFPNGGAQLVGSSYDGCITPRVQQSGPPVYRYYPWHPAPSMTPAWLFARTGLGPQSAIPGIVGYELDELTAAAPAGTQAVGSGGVPCMGEDEPSPVRGSIAQSTLYYASSGALVFATGTLGWLYGLSPVPQASPEAPGAPDPRLVAMTRNLLGRVLTAPVPSRRAPSSR